MKPWSTSEIRYLEHHAHEGVKAIAFTLGRSLKPSNHKPADTGSHSVESGSVHGAGCRRTSHFQSALAGAAYAPSKSVESVSHKR